MLVEGCPPGRGDAVDGVVILGWAAGGVIDGGATLGCVGAIMGWLTGRDGRWMVVDGTDGGREGVGVMMGDCGRVNPGGVDPAFGVEGVMNPWGRGVRASGRLTSREGAVIVAGVVGFAGAVINGVRFTGVETDPELEGVPTGRLRLGMESRKVDSGAVVTDGVVRRGSLPRDLGSIWLPGTVGEGFGVVTAG